MHVNPAWVSVNIAPPTTIVVVLDAAVALAAMEYVTVPVPFPVPLSMLTHAAEVVAVQEMQQRQARMLLNPDRLAARVAFWLMPHLLRLGLFRRLFRRDYDNMSRGVVPVRLTA